MNNLNKLYQEIGYIRGKVEEIDQKVDKLNGSVHEDRKQLQKHEIILGKFGVIFTVIVFGVSTAINFVVSWIREKL